MECPGEGVELSGAHCNFHAWEDPLSLGAIISLHKPEKRSVPVKHFTTSPSPQFSVSLFSFLFVMHFGAPVLSSLSVKLIQTLRLRRYCIT